MIRKFEPNKIVITEFFRVCMTDMAVGLISALSYTEFMDYVRKPALAYKEINDEFDTVNYTLISGPFDSYTEAEAARLQFIHDHCELPKEDFEL